ncbi:hypothetical protein LINPERHAP2_LOCUS35618 [Linum perenne]
MHSKNQHMPTPESSNGHIVNSSNVQVDAHEDTPLVRTNAPVIDNGHSPMPTVPANISVENTTEDMEQELRHEEVVTEENAIKKGRGKNKCGALAKLKQGEKLSVKFFMRRAVGDNGDVWVRKMGVIYRDPNIVPVQIKKWKDLSDIQLDHIWASIKENFQCDEMEENRANSLRHMGSLWNKWRSKLHVQHVKGRRKEEALKNVPPMMKKEDWEWCVNEVFLSEAYVKKSKTNKKNRQKELDNPSVRHRNGSKPSRQLIHALVEELDGEEPDLLTIFNTVYGRDGVVKDPGALAKLNLIEKKLEEDPDINTFDLIESAFGEHTHGTVAIFGGGVKPKDMKRKGVKNAELLAKLQQVEAEKNTLEKEMAEVKNAARLEAEQQKRRLDEIENNMVNMQAQMQAFINAQMQAFMNTNKVCFL